MQQVVVTRHIADKLPALLHPIGADRVFVLSDSNTARACLPCLKSSLAPFEPHYITITAGEEHKTIASLTDVWRTLSESGATRKSLLINVGGGVITDLGGFAAASFKRGIRCVNIPTTLLAAVDAAVGGKTGIDFNGLKNEIGAFHAAEAVVVSTHFYQTLDRANIISGYAEMLKHALLHDAPLLAQHLHMEFDPLDYVQLSDLVQQSIAIKQRIVEEDPREQGVRKALNLGHTVGHALESLALERGKPVLHGYAVAWGLVCELYLSAVHCNFPSELLAVVVRYIHSLWGAFPFGCTDYEALYTTMTHDKKNAHGCINFTLLSDVGTVAIDQHLSKEEIFNSLDFLREGF